VTQWIEILDQRLDASAAIAFVSAPEAGGIAVFLGTTRAEKNGASDLLALDYEAYQEMALKQLIELAQQARQKWPILKLTILHRIGRVNVGEPSVIIAVSTPHRAESFEACRWLIDGLKQQATIWKKEIWSDGTGRWVDPHA